MKVSIKTVIQKIVIFPIILYRKFISPFLPNSCRFYPSCSQYAIEAIEKRGIFIGVLLAIWRILRCNPFSKGGIDLVPSQIGCLLLAKFLLEILLRDLSEPLIIQI